MAPAATVAQSEDTMGRFIVCGVDGTTASRAAASQAARLARALGGRAVLVPIDDAATAAHALIAVAERESADLIVVPAGAGPSVETLMRDATCPVLIVRTRRLAAAA
jgi:nucleotide-binding universal stress UspA family protein